MQEFELQLLARLVNGFPAGNISVILLINSAGNYRKKLEAFGKNLLQWEVETKAGEPKRVLSDWVADTPDPAPASEPPVLQPMSLEDSEEALKQLNMPKKTSWRIPGLGKKPSRNRRQLLQRSLQRRHRFLHQHPINLKKQFQFLHLTSERRVNLCWVPLF